MSQVDHFTEGRAGASCVSCVCGCQVWARVCEKGVDGVLCGPKRTNAQRRVRTAVSRIFDSRDVAYWPLTQFLLSKKFMRVEPGHGVSLVFVVVVVVKAWARVCGKGGNDVVRDAQNYNV